MKVFVRTYGCRANQYDTEAVRQMLASAGVEETVDPSEADYAVLNSCTVTASAEADLRSDVRALARGNPGIRTVIMGCASGLPGRDEGVAPLRTLPRVSEIVAGADVPAVAAALGIRRSEPAGAASPGEVAMQTGARALLRIQEGCDEHCTFCATTLSRGSSRSRAVADVLHEARGLAVSHPEIVLTGIHIGSYGLDIGSSLGELVETLIGGIPDVRFRLSSVEATEVDDRLAALLGSGGSRLAPHLHAPLQSGSDSVLRRMGRHWYTASAYEAAVLRLTGTGRPFGLAADVISGFPGESESDHMDTVRLVERLPFTSLHVFPYSPRPGTAAVGLGDHVQASVAGRRARELRELAKEKAATYRSRRAGGDCDVVVTGRGKGLTEDYLSVSVSDASMPRCSRFTGVLRDVDGQLIAFPAGDTQA
ncbi:MAG: MiaB/RimO family radical SAM methylthiotransferase [Gemmatimonadaceae bacterium]|nr:MiaB/RimO family radical SAM methylthiotransferase [Gemmatimonadaceae bacterium]